MTTVAVVGSGVVGDRIVKRLPIVRSDADIVLVDTRQRAVPDGCTVAVLASPVPHAPDAARILERGIAVVSVSDDLEDVRALTDLQDLALANDVPLVVGAGMSPGLSGLLARHLAASLDRCDEIHLAVHGTAGPACAHQHHDTLGGRAVGLHDGEWISRPAGSGRELCWFPEPVGAYDCYRAEIPSPVLLHAAFPDVGRISARVSATRRDRLTARLPMLRPPHPEGGVGALRVEVRGADGAGERVTLVVGIAEQVGTAAAATATAFTRAVLDRVLPAGLVTAGDAELDTLRLLHDVERLGVRLQEFTGIPTIQGVAR